jgi:hypothetical protein
VFLRLLIRVKENSSREEPIINKLIQHILSSLIYNYLKNINMKTAKQTSKLLVTASLLFVAMLMGHYVNAQVINEGFEEVEWVAGTATGTPQPSSVVTVNAAGTASINNGTWSYSNAVPVGTGSTGTLSTIVRNGNKGLWFGQTGGSFIITPLITSGIATVTFSAYPYGSSSTGVYVAVATNTAVTSASGSLTSSATSGTAGQWTGSAYNSTLNSASGFSATGSWVTISFTTNIPSGQAAYLKIQRQTGGQFFIDDIVVTSSPAVPVNFSAVSASKKENAVTVNWNVASQVNVKRFSLEKSSDGSSFTEVTSVEAKHGQTSYSAKDTKPFIDINYYKVKAIDNDGSFKYSKTIVVTTKAKNELMVYPNPARAAVTVSHPSSNDKSVIKIVSAGGRRMMTYNVAGNATQSLIDVSKLTSGNYLLIYDDGKSSLTTKLVRQ